MADISTRYVSSHITNGLEAINVSMLNTFYVVKGFSLLLGRRHKNDIKIIILKNLTKGSNLFYYLNAFFVT